MTDTILEQFKSDTRRTEYTYTFYTCGGRGYTGKIDHEGDDYIRVRYYDTGSYGTTRDILIPKHNLGAIREVKTSNV